MRTSHSCPTLAQTPIEAGMTTPFPNIQNARITSATLATTPPSTIERLVQVLVDLLGNPSTRAFQLPDNLGQHWDAPP
jgi:hypothetical protein